MTDEASFSTQAKLCFDDTAIDTSSQPFEFRSHSLRRKRRIINNMGMNGSRSLRKERNRLGNLICGGTILFEAPSPAELDYLLPLILGTAESSDSFAVAETLPEFLVCADNVTKVLTFTGCKVNQAIFYGSSGGPLYLALEVWAKNCTEANAGTFPALSLDTDSRYIFCDSASGITLQGTGSREVDQFRLVIRNLLSRRFSNSCTATSIRPRSREVYLGAKSPYIPTNSDLLTTPMSSAAGAAGSVVFTNGGQSLTATFANLLTEAEDPEIRNRAEIELPLLYQAYQSGSTKEVVFTHDSAA